MGDFELSVGFSTSRDAMFIATPEELLAALPGWRVPLARPRPSSVLNPFTGETISGVLTRDPGPRNRPPIPEQLSFTRLLLPSCEYWERHYLALDLAVSESPALSEEEWEDYLDLMYQRGLTKDSLLGGTDDPGAPCWVYSIPAHLCSAVAELSDDALPELESAWRARLPYELDYSPASYLKGLRALTALARSEGRELFSWNVHPYFRADSASRTG